MKIERTTQDGCIRVDYYFPFGVVVSCETHGDLPSLHASSSELFAWRVGMKNCFLAKEAGQ